MDRTLMTDRPLKIALLSPHRDYMGDSRSVPILAEGLAKLGHEVDLLQSWREWEHVESVAVRVVSLRTRWFAPVLPDISKISKWAAYRLYMAVIAFAMMPGLIWYLYRTKPDILVVRMLTGPTILFVKLFRLRVKLLISASGIPRHSGFRDNFWPLIYGKADGYVVAAPGVADMVSKISGVPRADISVLWEAVVDDRMFELATQAPAHPWFDADGPKIVMGLGRLTRQKDFKTLVRAFAKVRKSTPLRLVILGEGEDRPALEAEISLLGIADDVDLPGFWQNPYPELSRCHAFVLSSVWESSNHSLIEAQGLGVPSITTDCPSGQKEIAMDGETALIVPVGDIDAMADAIEKLIIGTSVAERLSQNALKNSDRFKSEATSKMWEKKIVSVVNGRGVSR
jgi:glycosyltransferase involved in cell wall biosynthesis